MFAGAIAITGAPSDFDQCLTGECIERFATAPILNCEKAKLFEIERCGLRHLGQNISGAERERNRGKRGNSNVHDTI